MSEPFVKQAPVVRVCQACGRRLAHNAARNAKYCTAQECVRERWRVKEKAQREGRTS